MEGNMCRFCNSLLHMYCRFTYWSSNYQKGRLGSH